MPSRLVLWLFLLLIWIRRCSSLYFSLDGSSWIVLNLNRSISIPARVPGGIYTALLESNIIEDPYYRFNDVEYKWIGRENWTYFTTFEAPGYLFEKKAVFLTCHGLDTVSTVTVNGKVVGNSDNMFRRYRMDIKGALRKGTNVIVVAFQSAVDYALKKHLEQLQRYVIPPTCPPPVQNGECHVNYIRKTQSSFSWDWGPSFPSQGIWKSIGIDAFDTAIIQDITVQTLQGTDPNTWVLQGQVFLEASDLWYPIKGTLTWYLGRQRILQKQIDMAVQGDLSIAVDYSVALSQMKIEKWWPNGYGNQTLYNLTVGFTDSTGSETSYKSIRVGFRTVELVQDKLPNATGLTFYFRVNGIPVFAKGSNWVPADSFPERITSRYLEHLLQSAKMANMNMLRVWGGGMYESDEFYDMCDELGIMIWQDMMFAVALYPVDVDFLSTVTVEVTQQIQRLQHHPSIVIWAGNNENEAAIAGSWWPMGSRVETYKRDYVQLYISTIKPIVERLDPSRPFVPSSPSNGPETEKEGWISTDPGNSLYGDVHFYDYSSDSWEWMFYPTPRFASEYGFQSFPSFETLAKVSIPEDWEYRLPNPFIKHREHQTFGTVVIVGSIGNHMKLPSLDGGLKSFKDFLYLSQIDQAMSIKTETEHYRRKMSSLDATGQGHTMGALYWMLNDIWQAPTWSSIEFGGKWKILHYFANGFFSPVLVSPYVNQKNIEIIVVSDLREVLRNLTLQVAVYKWSSFTPTFLNKSAVDVPPLKASSVYKVSGTDLLSRSQCSNSLNDCFLYVELTGPDRRLYSTNFLLFAWPKNAIGMQKAEIQVVDVDGPVENPDSSTCQFEYSITLKTSAVAAFVWMQVADNPMGYFSDNGFLLVKPTWRGSFCTNTNISSDDLKQSISVTSLTDTADYAK